MEYFSIFRPGLLSLSTACMQHIFGRKYKILIGVAAENVDFPRLHYDTFIIKGHMQYKPIVGDFLTETQLTKKFFMVFTLGVARSFCHKGVNQFCHKGVNQLPKYSNTLPKYSNTLPKYSNTTLKSKPKDKSKLIIIKILLTMLGDVQPSFLALAAILSFIIHLSICFLRFVEQDIRERCVCNYHSTGLNHRSLRQLVDYKL
uniref:Uncharacterized protein n=1 Tax=Glossina brevipalpis TaxID=37001 RepID=A0A1A9WIC8_9MUSC